MWAGPPRSWAPSRIRSTTPTSTTSTPATQRPHWLAAGRGGADDDIALGHQDARTLRVDAGRNPVRIDEAAEVAFAEHFLGVPLEDVAEEAAIAGLPELGRSHDGLGGVDATKLLLYCE